MTNRKSATDFDQIIQADRQRRKNEDLAKEIFGRTKANDAAGKKDHKRAPKTASLASRIGINKRSSSASSITAPRNLPSRPSSAAAHHVRQNRLAEEIHNSETSNIVATKPKSLGLSIKGSAAPFVVEACNFEPGTTDADIASAVKQDCLDSNGNNTLVSCKIVATEPTVIAELVITERSIADNIIAKYDNRKADGRKLKLRIARSGPGSLSKHHQRPETPQPSLPVVDSIQAEDDDIMIDTEDEPNVSTANTYNTEREEAEQNRRDRDSRRDRDDYTAGSRRRDDERRRNDRDRDEEQDSGRERERKRERDPDREREYPREERTERPSYQRDDQSGSRPSHYGNGVGGGSRPVYGSGYAGGRGQYPAYGGGYGRGNYRGGFRGYR